jgi:hypothetical protein
MRGDAKQPHTHAVWWRYESKGKVVTAWHSPPKLYCSERSAIMAAKDLNRYYTTEDLGNFMRHIALPLGQHPNTLNL